MPSLKKIALYALPIVVIGGWWGYNQLNASIDFQPQTEAELAALVAESKAQNETAFYQPQQRPRPIKPANPLNNGLCF